MQPVKRIEIVVESTGLSRVVEVLEELGLPHRTVIPGIYGHGDHGVRGGGAFSALDNTYVLVAVEPSAAPALVDRLRPLLHTLGGMCLVSDAEAVLH